MEEDLFGDPGPPDHPQYRVAELGQPLSEFTVGGSRLLFRSAVAFLLLLAGLVLIALPLIAFLKRARGRGRLFKLLVVGGALAVAAMVLLVRAVHSRRLRVLVFPEGVVRIHGAEARTFFWEEIHTLWHKTPKGLMAWLFQPSLEFVACRGKGEEFRFDDSLPHIKQLGEALQRQTLRHLLPRALAAYQSGGETAFGSLRVSQAGLNNGSETLPWDQVQKVRISDDAVSISREGKWLSDTTPVSEVPNFHVLRALLKQTQDARLVDDSSKTAD